MINRQTQSPQLGKLLVERTQKPYWWIRLIGLLLLLQGSGLLAISVYLIRWLATQSSQRWDFSSLRKVEAFWASTLFVPLAILTLLTAVSFILLRPMGWLLAMLIQGLTLLSALILYFQWKSDFVYPIMLYCIIMVLYLNSAYVRRVFYDGARSQE